MPLHQNQQKQIMDLLILALEGQAAGEDLAQLRDILDASSDARDYYLRAVITAECIRKNEWEAKDFGNEFEHEEGVSAKTWEALSLEEKTAPGIKLAKEESQDQPLQKVIYLPREKRRLTMFSKIVLALNAAAVLFIILFLKLAPTKSIEVATLSDSINAKWQNVAGSMEKGTRLTTRSNVFCLREGLAELLFDTNARVVIQGPAEFELLAKDQISLRYGRIYATVPREAIGFIIDSPTSRLIDLGTEFGIQIDARGDMYLHVIKGKTALIAGTSNKVQLDVREGQAKKVSGATLEVSDVPCETGLFVRDIDSENQFIWKGQKTFDLADVAGGGNGFGTGTGDLTINPVSGMISKDREGTRQSANDYHPVPSSAFIDGVFVPNGTMPQIVSSGGHSFPQCPVTSGFCCDNLYAMTTIDTEVFPDANVSNLQTHCLFMHANMGITFDLKTVRGLLPGVEISRFQSKFGIRKWAARSAASNADFWVLVDGELRFKQEHVKIGELHSIDIELSAKDRFLTLIETDGGDPEDRVVDGAVRSSIDSDWGMFADPVLILK